MHIHFLEEANKLICLHDVNYNLLYKAFVYFLPDSYSR